MIYPKPSQRYENFSLNQSSPLYRGLVFAGLGGGHGSTRYVDSARQYIGTLTNYSGAGDTPAERWRFDPYLRRWAVGLDGSNDYVNLGTSKTLKPTGAFTICAWCRCDNSGYGDYGVIGDLGSAGDRANWIEIVGGAVGVQGATAVISETGAAQFAVQVTGLTNFSGVWNHWAMIFVPSVGLYLYRNGKVLGSNTTSVPASAYQNTLPVVLGARGNFQYFLSGLIADPLIMLGDQSRFLPYLADPGNADLRVGGIPLILPTARRLWGVGAVAGGWKPAWAARRQRAVGTGVI